MLKSETETGARLLGKLDAARSGTGSRQELDAGILTEASRLLKTTDGIAWLYGNIERFVDSGLFLGTAWQEPDGLVPSLVKGTLCSGYPMVVYESLNELRMLKLALDSYEGQPYPAEKALQFMQEAVIASFDLAFEEGGEESRYQLSSGTLKRLRLLFQFILERLPITRFKDKLIREVVEVSAHRPIVTHRLREMLELIHRNYEVYRDDPSDEVLSLYFDAAFHPTRRSRETADLDAYKELIRSEDLDVLLEEGRTMADKMRRTGLVSRQHVALLQLLVLKAPGQALYALSLDEHGRAEFNRHQSFVIELLRDFAVQGNEDVVYGMSCMLNRNLFSRPAVLHALKKLLHSQLNTSVRQRLQGGRDTVIGPDAKQLVIGGVIRMLGQPLGVGQGLNPTCQSARGLSMWSQHSPGKLLNMLISAVVADKVEFRFQGELISSTIYSYEEAFDLDLDPVSVVLVPLLDNVYKQMMQRSQQLFPLQDPHVTVNPAFYGLWIPTGFKSCYNASLNAIQDYTGFVRTFYQVFHPDYNSGFRLVYPLPVGIFITTSQGEFLGFHAISLLRISKTPEGETRAYFFNPNNDGRQNWGQGIKPTVMDNGERYGESSLPFYQLLSRIYAYHYNAIEAGTTKDVAVPTEEIGKVEKLAKESWGKKYFWD